MSAVITAPTGNFGIVHTRYDQPSPLMTIVAPKKPEPLLRWDYLAGAAAAIAGMIAAIASAEFWVLDFVHVFSSLLWTGIDLFMGFVLSPILRRADVSVRRAIAARLTARTLVLMPTLAVISGTNSSWSR
jgi:hypothetical protein